MWAKFATNQHKVGIRYEIIYIVKIFTCPTRMKALFVVSVLTAKPVFVVSLPTAKSVFLVSVGLRVFQKNLKFTIFLSIWKWNYIVLDACNIFL